MTERELMLAAWDDLWINGRWAAPWRRTLEGLTADQAAWKPRKSASGIPSPSRRGQGEGTSGATSGVTSGGGGSEPSPLGRGQGEGFSGGGGVSGGGHSIWQIVNHIVFWRGYVIDRMRGGPTLPDAEVAARTFEEPKSAHDASWRNTVEQFAASQQRVREALAADTCNVDRVRGMPYHDCYHIGQIMTLRALQGLKPVE